MPKINTPYATVMGLERYSRVVDTVEVHPGHTDGVLLILRRADDPMDRKGAVWPLDVAHTQHLIALLQAACKQPD